jgi:hypothetical protein
MITRYSVKRVNICFKFLLFSVLAGGLAQAQATRTWVSGVGDDANPCSRTAPCKTFAGAISKTAASGEIDVLDPGGFGTVTVTKAITIDGSQGQIGSVLASGTNGVVINAGASDSVTLRNLSINGAGTGINGVNLINAKALHIENCTISNFTQQGIYIQTNAGGQVSVFNTISRDNGDSGIRAVATFAKVFVTVEKSRFENNNYGIWAGDFSRFAIRDSEASGNASAGFIAQANAGDVIANITLSTASNNLATGIQAGGGSNLSIIRMAGNSILSNGVNGIVVGSNGSVVSFGGNVNSGTGAPTSTTSLQ